MLMTLEAFRERWRLSPTGCWLWKVNIGGLGYGQAPLGQRGRHMGAHRMSWLLHRGLIPRGLFVLHRCDVRRCVNPDHLFLGTPAENSADMKAKGRQSKGPERGMLTRVERKLDAEKVAAIWVLIRAGESDAAIGGRFDVTKTMIWRIRNRRVWKHVT